MDSYNRKVLFTVCSCQHFAELGTYITESELINLDGENLYLFCSSKSIAGEDQIIHDMMIVEIQDNQVRFSNLPIEPIKSKQLFIDAKLKSAREKLIEKHRAEWLTMDKDFSDWHVMVSQLVAA